MFAAVSINLIILQNN